MSSTSLAMLVKVQAPASQNSAPSSVYAPFYHATWKVSMHASSDSHKLSTQHVTPLPEEVFGRLEVNKNLALHQVEHWDGVESERILSERETELKKEAKEKLSEVGAAGRTSLEAIVQGTLVKGRG
ncbi:hypothetical protein CK203_101413 [Vitis vinifera]|uniref:Uncharacterized protein n=1 Tax=Vitis vinifera TaxID=29760 RepID=A0A438FGY9_VITVI|nr:hypothetical protein CK203_101413 [Vitis vinifera]